MNTSIQSSQPHGEVANTLKPSTIIFIILALILPLWPITLPLFLWLAHKSYKGGEVIAYKVEGQANNRSLDELDTARKLLDAGTISREEFDRIKEQTIG